MGLVLATVPKHGRGVNGKSSIVICRRYLFFSTLSLNTITLDFLKLDICPVVLLYNSFSFGLFHSFLLLGATYGCDDMMPK